MSDLEAGRLIHDLGVNEAAQLIARAFKAAFPEAKDDSEQAGNAKPKNRGTGRKP
jgi:hypothetical protein